MKFPHSNYYTGSLGVLATLTFPFWNQIFSRLIQIGFDVQVGIMDEDEDVRIVMNVEKAEKTEKKVCNFTSSTEDNRAKK